MFGVSQIKSEVSSGSDEDCKPPEIREVASTTVINNVLPQKSKHAYEHHYQQFMDWRKDHSDAESFSENVVLAYFSELSTKMKSSTLWKIYSMLRTTINSKHNIDLANYVKLRSFLKRKSDGFQAKQSKTLTGEQVETFINEAPDAIYLATKVAVIVGIMGGCRKHELWHMKTDHIQDLGAAISITIPDRKTKLERMFTITGNFCAIFRKYWTLRPASVEHDHFFINYQKGRCTKQIIGINKLGSMPKQVAIFLGLENPEQYTGHCLRRSSVTMSVDEVAESYVDSSINSKINIANKILEGITPQNLKPTTSTTAPSTVTVSLNESSCFKGLDNVPNLNFNNCNVTIIVNKNENKPKCS